MGLTIRTAWAAAAARANPSRARRAASSSRRSAAFAAAAAAAASRRRASSRACAFRARTRRRCSATRPACPRRAARPRVRAWTFRSSRSATGRALSATSRRPASTKRATRTDVAPRAGRPASPSSRWRRVQPRPTSAARRPPPFRYAARSAASPASSPSDASSTTAASTAAAIASLLAADVAPGSGVGGGLVGSAGATAGELGAAFSLPASGVCSRRGSGGGDTLIREGVAGAGSVVSSRLRTSGRGAGELLRSLSSLSLLSVSGVWSAAAAAFHTSVAGSARTGAFRGGVWTLISSVGSGGARLGAPARSSSLLLYVNTRLYGAGARARRRGGPSAATTAAWAASRSAARRAGDSDGGRRAGAVRGRVGGPRRPRSTEKSATRRAGGLRTRPR